jgi:predicted kinase
MACFKVVTFIKVSISCYLLVVKLERFIYLSFYKLIMSRPKLVATMALPSSGKSVVSDYLAEHGYVRLSSDDLRFELFGVTDYPSFIDSPDGPQRESFMQQFMALLKEAHLSTGRDVVIDTTGNTQGLRDHHFYDRVPDCDRYLLEITVSDEELARRNSERGRTNDPTAFIRSYREEAQPDPNVAHLLYENETREDLERMLRGVHEELVGGTYTGIRIPVERPNYALLERFGCC